MGIAIAQGPATGRNAPPPVILSQPITLEDGPDDTTFLDCAATVLQPDFRHHDNQGALMNPLKEADATRVASIAGHGHPGKVCTSDGIYCEQVPPQSINVNNRQSWWAWAGSWPRKFQSLTILACDTGQGPEGLRLLTAIADAAKMPVRAPTDFIWCSKEEHVIVLDENAKWQEAAPDRPSTEPVPFKTREYETMTPQTNMQISVDRKPQGIPFGSAEVIVFSTIGTEYPPAVLELDAGTSNILVTKINFRNALITSYVPDADVTARFDLEIDFDHRKIKKHYMVLNDRLVNDVEDRRFYYRTMSSFTEQLRALRSRR